jgi:uncharacterized OB-fold protein
MPLPIIDDDTKEYWSACREKRLVVQQCASCATFRFGPAPVCFACHSRDYRLVESAGFGEVYTWTITHHSVHQATDEHVPYNTIVVRLNDCGNALVPSNLVEADGVEIAAGLSVEVVWDTMNEEILLPRFRPLDLTSIVRPGL